MLQGALLNTLFKNKLPSSEVKPCLNFSEFPKATCTRLSSYLLGKQTGNRQQTGDFMMFWLNATVPGCNVQPCTLQPWGHEVSPSGVPGSCPKFASYENTFQRRADPLWRLRCCFRSSAAQTSRSSQRRPRRIFGKDAPSPTAPLRSGSAQRAKKEEKNHLRGT